MSRINMPVAEEKTLGPTQLLEYLGLLLDIVNQRIGIPTKKREKCLELIQELLLAKEKHQSVRIRQIQKVAGTLNFICQALPAGKLFMNSLYSLTHGKAGKVQGHHRKRISQEVYNDLSMFKQFLHECAHLSVKYVPFLIKLGVHSNSLQLYSDSAGREDRGLGCRFGTHWAQGFWSDTILFKDGFKPNIALLELLAVIIAIEILCKELSSKTIILHCYNEAAVTMINRKKSDIPAAMNLIRHLTITCLHHQMFVQDQYIKTSLNTWTDLLSRNRMSEFRAAFPEADPALTPLPRSLWPPNWTPSQMLSSHQS